jgi:hypothetical protein
LGGETLIWKNFYKNLLILRGKSPVEGAKENPETPKNYKSFYKK